MPGFVGFSEKTEEQKANGFKDSVTVNLINDAFRNTLNSYEGNFDTLVDDLVPRIQDLYDGNPNPKLNMSAGDIDLEISYHYTLSKMGILKDHTDICDLELNNDKTVWIMRLLDGLGHMQLYP